MLQLLAPGATGPAVDELKRELAAWFAAHPPPPRLPFIGSPGYGPAVTEAVRTFQRRTGLWVDGIAGPQVRGALDAWRRFRQDPPLPSNVSFPLDEYPPHETWLGLQPWIVPQARALALHFALTITEGWGSSPPHVRRSDHRWGGALDLAGLRYRMISCATWAERYAAEPYRRGAVFRYAAFERNHVHVSWFRAGPATSVFATAEFA